MVKRLLSLLLVLLVPMQAMAALSMDLQMQHAPSIAVELDRSDTSANHACHQEVSATKADGTSETSSVNPGGCHSCPLCMAFGLGVDAVFLLTADHLTQSVNQYTQTFLSADPSGSIKPPIL